MRSIDHRRNGSRLPPISRSLRSGRSRLVPGAALLAISMIPFLNTSSFNNTLISVTSGRKFSGAWITSSSKLSWPHGGHTGAALARPGGTAGLDRAGQRPDPPAERARRAVAARRGHQPLRVSGHGLPVGVARPHAADERAREAGRGFTAPVVPGGEPPGETRLGASCARSRRRALHARDPYRRGPGQGNADRARPPRGSAPPRVRPAD